MSVMYFNLVQLDPVLENAKRKFVCRTRAIQNWQLNKQFSAYVDVHTHAYVCMRSNFSESRDDSNEFNRNVVRDRFWR